jgi:poly(A) polymerase
MQDYGLLPAVLGAAPRPTLLARLAAIEAALGLTPDAALRLAALAVEIPEDAERLRDRLRLSNDQAAKLVRASWYTPDADLGPSKREAPAKDYLYLLGQAAYQERVLIGWARSGGAPEDQSWRHLWSLPERWQRPTFPLRGADVLALGVPAGPRVGEILRTLQAWWVDGGFTADEAALRARLAELAARDRQ